MPGRRRSKKPARKSTRRGRKSAARAPKLRYAGEMQRSWIPAAIKIALTDPRSLREVWSRAQKGEKFYNENSDAAMRKEIGRAYPPFEVLAHIGYYSDGDVRTARETVDRYDGFGLAAFGQM